MGKLHSPTKTPQPCDRDHMCNTWVRYRRGPTSASSTVNSRLTELGNATPFTCFYKQHTACCSKIKEMEISSWCPSNVIQLSTAFILSIHQLMYSCCPSDITWLWPCITPSPYHTYHASSRHFSLSPNFIKLDKSKAHMQQALLTNLHHCPPTLYSAYLLVKFHCISCTI